MTPEIAYRLLEDLAVALRLPIHHKTFDETTPDIHLVRDGIGDLELLAHLDVLDLELLEGFSTTLTGGLTLPTGRIEAQPVVGFTAPTPLQLGSGTFDPLLAVSVQLRVIDNLRVTIASAARFAMYANKYDYRAASVFEGTLGTEWAVLPKYVAVDLRLVGSHVTKAVVEDIAIPNTGRDALYIQPGIGIGPFFGFSASASVRVPPYLRVNETQFAEAILVEARIAYRSPPLF